MGWRKDVSICLVLVIMDVVAGVLGIQAQLAQNRQERYTKVWILECREPSYEAYRLALAALMLLALAHAVALTLGGTICISSEEEFASSPCKKKIAACSLILSWTLALVAFSLLVIGAVSNARPQDTFGLSHRHLLSIGGIICFIHGLFIVVYYISATATVAEEDSMINNQIPTA